MKATADDQRGVEAVKEHMPDLMHELARQRKVRDITHEESRLPVTSYPSTSYACNTDTCSSNACNKEENRLHIEKMRRLNQNFRSRVKTATEKAWTRSSSSGGRARRIPQTPEDAQRMADVRMSEDSMERMRQLNQRE
eukprot:2537560-Amphidinium_carterae.2